MTIQVAVKLPDDLIHAVDLLVDGGAFDSRSAAIRSGLELIVAGRRRQEIDRRFHDGVRRLPETDAEIASATRLAIDAINDEPWERWW